MNVISFNKPKLTFRAKVIKQFSSVAWIFLNVLVHNLWISGGKISHTPPPPGAEDECKMHAAGLPGQRLKIHILLTRVSQLNNFYWNNIDA